MHRKLSAAILLGMMCNICILAQDAPKPKGAVSANLFGGFSYANYELLSVDSNTSSDSFSISSTQSGSGRLSLYGWNAAIAGNFNSWFGLVADVSGNYRNGSASLTQTVTASNCPIPGKTTCSETFNYIAPDPRIHNVLLGPQFAYPHGKVRPFARAIVGASHRNFVWPQVGTVTAGVSLLPSSVSTSNSGNFFSMALGGGADYAIHRKFAWRTTVDYLTGQGTGQNHMRISSGVLWRLGK